MRVLLKLLVPYIAVGVFWCGLSSAWGAILAYHALILIGLRRADWRRLAPLRPRALALALPAAAHVLADLGLVLAVVEAV